MVIATMRGVGAHPSQPLGIAPAFRDPLLILPLIGSRHASHATSSPRNYPRVAVLQTGRTALSIATARGYTDLVELLLGSGREATRQHGAPRALAGTTIADTSLGATLSARSFGPLFFHFRSNFPTLLSAKFPCNFHVSMTTAENSSPPRPTATPTLSSSSSYSATGLMT